MSEPALPADVQRVTLGGTACLIAGSGSPIVFVHGVGMAASIWAPQMMAFADRHQVIAYDLLGHGGSDLPPAAPTLADYARQLLALLDRLAVDKAVVVGHSMGSLITLEFALTYPDRATHVIPMNGVYRRTAEQRAGVVARADALQTSGMPEVDATIARWFGTPIPTALEAEAQFIAQYLRAVDPVGYARTYRLFATSDDAHVARLPTLAMPALFMTGELDPNSTPAMSQAMAAAAPFGSATVLAGERHMMSVTAAEQVNHRIQDFITQSAAKAPARAARS